MKRGPGAGKLSIFMTNSIMRDLCVLLTLNPLLIGAKETVTAKPLIAKFLVVTCKCVSTIRENNLPLV